MDAGVRSMQGLGRSAAVESVRSKRQVRAAAVSGEAARLIHEEQEQGPKMMGYRVGS